MARLVAMMDATDAWPAVRTARRWVLDEAAVGPGDWAVDVGSGPGTFGALARDRGASTVDLDRSWAMLRAGRRRHRSPGASADVRALPLPDGVATLVRAERVLQWTDDPDAALVELLRITSPGGMVAVTDTDWTTFRVDHDDPTVAARWTAAAEGWVPHARLASALADRLDALGAHAIASRRDTVELTDWDPTDGVHADGPPGLPLGSIAAGAPSPAERVALRADVDALADRARARRFRARLELVTVCAGPPPTATGQKSVRYSSS